MYIDALNNDSYKQISWDKYGWEVEYPVLGD